MSQTLLEAIEHQFVQLNYRWKVFLQLFDSGQENIDLLNASGRNVFALFQKLLIDDAMGSLCRLTDPAGTGDKTNASLKKLLEASRPNLDSSAYDNLVRILNEIEVHMKNIRTLRNKAMFHASLDHAVGVKPPIQVTYDEIEKSMEGVREFLNALGGNSSEYTPSIPFGTDGNKLLSALAKAHGNG